MADYIVKPSLSLSDHYSHKTGPQLNSLGPGNTIDILSQVASHPRGIKLLQYNLQFTAPKIPTKVSSVTKNNINLQTKENNVLFHFICLDIPTLHHSHRQSFVSYLMLDIYLITEKAVKL